MSTSRRRGRPTPLENVRRRFEQWRRSRAVRTRIPDPLWTAAVKMAGRYGVHQTAKALRIDYYGLKKRAEAEGVIATGVPAGREETTFVELTAPLPAPSGECLVELEDVGGAKMRVHRKRTPEPYTCRGHDGTAARGRTPVVRRHEEAVSRGDQAD